MVTEAGKELLRNSINTANFHNKILEQNEMWKQWEIERGLTMMVSDDDILKKIRKNHRCSKHQKLEESKEWTRGNSSSDIVAGTSSADRWDHSGFQELYPDETNEKKPSSSLKERSKKWDHSGFHELYPDEVGRERSSSASSSSKGGSKRLREMSSDEEEEKSLASSSGRKCKKKCRCCQERCFNAVNLGKCYRKKNQEKCYEDIQKIMLLISEGKKCKGKPTDYNYDKFYNHKMSPPLEQKKKRKRKKRRQCSHFKRPSYSSSESLAKWDHNGFYDLYPDFCKREKSSKHDT